ncbi:hypothetical protein EV363DRAFT_1178587 [Boletus edulis]|nr:hypothetical protein EV363DRAFT_1178587 [Boletus edulis]
MLVRGRSTTTADENNQRSITDVNDVPDKSPEPPWPPDKPETHRETLIEEERKGVTTQGQLTTADEANDQRNLSGVEDVPEGLPDPPKPPDVATNRRNKSPRVKLEGERRGDPSFEDTRTGDEADVTGVSGNVEGVGDMPSELPNTSELEHERSETRQQGNSPRRARSEPDEPGREAAAQRSYQRIQEGPRTVRNERVDRTNAPNQDTRPGGHMGPQEVTRVVEGDSGRGNVVEGGAHNGIDPRSHGNERVIETRALRRGRRPGGLIEVQEARRDIERELKRGIDADGVQMDGNGDGTGAATSAAHRDSKRVETDALAEYQANQHGKPKRTKTDVPEASKPPSNHLRRSTDHANPPRRRGQLKSNPRSVNTTGLTHQATKTHRD